MFWPWILLPLAACCCNNRPRRRCNPCRRLDDPCATFPRMNVYRGEQPCRRTPSDPCD